MSYKDLDLESKFARLFNVLRNKRPFYSAVYESMHKIESDKVKTMQVSSTEIMYNRKFLEELEFEQMVFANLHELAHVALMHVSRRKNRDGLLWNIACDLYVNKLLVEEFNLSTDEETCSLDMQDKDVAFIPGSLYCESLDLDNDYTEKIYSEFYRQADENGYNKAKASNISNDDESKKLYRFTYTGSLQNSNRKPFEIYVRLDDETDIMDDGLDPLYNESENRRILQEATTRAALHGGYSLEGGSIIEKYVNDVLKSHIDWRKLLRKYCRQVKSTDSSFSSPDMRMYYQKAIYPGQEQYADDKMKLQGVKICIDSSGSISDTDLAYFHGQVLDILKKYNMDAELIYWDTEALSEGQFSDSKSFRHLPAVGGRGTSPECIFNYFDSKKCKVKPVVTLVFTDAYFCEDFGPEKWKKKYKDTIWIMTRDFNDGFKPPFGKITLAKYSD